MRYKREFCIVRSRIFAEIGRQAFEQIQADADKIYQLILRQRENLSLPACPFYEEVLDTQIYGLSKEIDFAVRLGLVDEKQGKEVIDFLEKQLVNLFEKSEPLNNNNI